MRLVAGPPCGGKTTYVRTHAESGERIVDFDDIIEGLGFERYSASPLVIEQARLIWMGAIPGADWVIWTAPQRRQRGRLRSMHQADVIVVMAPMDVCLERARAERPTSWQQGIRSWFAEWEPSRSGRESIVWTVEER